MAELTPGIRTHVPNSQPAPGFSDLESKPKDLLEDKSEVNRQVQHEGAVLQAHYAQARQARKGKSDE